MKKYKCSICNKIIEVEDITKLDKCPVCGAPVKFLTEVEDDTHEEKEDEVEKIPVPISLDNPAIYRIEEKCIKCGRCNFICKKQVGINYDYNKSTEPICVHCGQCVLNCPTGALVPKYNYKKVLDYLHDTEKIVICDISPAVRVSIGEEFNMPSGTNVEKKLVGALKDAGFDYVLDTTFGADLTIMEEASELVERIKTNTNLPQFTSCCPAWVKYVEMYHPEIIKNLSTCKSPISMQGIMIKEYFSKVKNIDPNNIVVVSITPCTAKKYEIKREELPGTDIVITATETALLLKEEEIDLNDVKEKDFDSIFGRGSGAGVIFGNSGGVMEAALRCSYHILTGKNPDKKLLDFSPVRGYNNMKEASITINDKVINILVVHGLSNTKEVIEEVKNGSCKYDFIEVMNCPGGCVGGGGQPLGVVSKLEEIVNSRIKGLYKEDSELKIKSSYENPDIIEVYENFLEKPLSPISEKLLHTKYTDKSDILGE